MMGYTPGDNSPCGHPGGKTPIFWALIDGVLTRNCHFEYINHKKSSRGSNLVLNIGMILQRKVLNPRR